MTPSQYHRVLIGLDQALFAIHEASAGEVHEFDVELRKQIEVIRSNVLKAESGHPFPFQTEDKNWSATGSSRPEDPDTTRAPW